MKCKNCGAEVTDRFCPYCGSQNADYEKNNSKEPQKAEYYNVQINNYGTDKNTANTVNQPKKKYHWFWKVLGWLVIPYIMVLILIWKSEKLSTLWKVILTTIVLLITYAISQS